MRLLGLAMICLSAGAQPFISGEDAGYIDSAECAGCHREIAARYRQTGMGRSFYRMGPAKIVEDFQRSNTYYHQASDRPLLSYFKMNVRTPRPLLPAPVSAGFGRA
jgi:hypothetical protein